MNDEQNTLLIQLGVKMDTVKFQIDELGRNISSLRHSTDNRLQPIELRIGCLEKWQVKMETSFKTYAVVFGFVITLVSTIISAYIVKTFFE